MGYRALTNVSLGIASVAPGEEIPAKYSDHLGGEYDVDFERLVELGAAEEIGKRAPSPESALSSLSRDELNAHAVEAGVDAPEALPNKQAVIDAIAAAQSGE